MKNIPSNEPLHHSEGKIIPNHEYDGIQELDNPLPNWWLATFYLSIVFGIFYFAYYALGPGLTPGENLQNTLRALEFSPAKQNASKGPDSKILQDYAQSPEQIKKGREVFSVRCASCHGPNGEGLIGPSLTDTTWIHGKGSLEDIAQTAYNGVNEKGMPAWGNILKPEEFYAVVVYVKTLSTKP